MQSNFKFTQKNALNSLNEIFTFSPSLDFISNSSFKEVSLMFRIDKTNIGVIPIKFDEIKESLLNNTENPLDLIILINKLGNFNLKVKEPLKNLFQEIFASPCFPSREEFIKVLKAGRLAVASFGQSKSSFKIDEAVRNALRDALKITNITSAKAAFLHIQFNYPLFESDFHRAIEILHEALNEQAPICCSFKLGKSKLLKAFLILTGFNTIEELIRNKNDDILSYIFNLEPESVTNEEQNLNLDLELPTID